MEEVIIIYHKKYPYDDRIDPNMGSIKFKLPKFYGKTDPKFKCHSFSDEKRY